VSEERHDVVGKLYCAPCWAIWDRCGQWPSALRVKTTMLPIGAAGLPVFAPDEAYCIADFASSLGDESVLIRLRSEMPQYQEWHAGRHHAIHFQDWSRDQGNSPQILKEIATKLEATFGIKASSVRVNRYRSQADYKPLHHDRRHDVNGRPQYTVGLSIGAKRELVLVHRRTSFTVNFPLANGSVFAFGPELNDQFLHGVPIQASNPQGQLPSSSHLERLSIIAWGSKVANIHELSTPARANSNTLPLHSPAEPSVPSRGPPTCRPAPLFARRAPQQLHPVVLAFRIAPESIGSFLGRGGQRLNDIRSRVSGAVTIQTVKVNSWLRVILRGESNRVQVALHLCRELASQ
jgi:alkylated DNA repair dioxygenase AlkB